jgi:hypothetical protein
MDNERRRYIKGGAAIGLLIGSGAFLSDGIRRIVSAVEENPKQEIQQK